MDASCTGNNASTAIGVQQDHLPAGDQALAVGPVICEQEHLIVDSEAYSSGGMWWLNNWVAKDTIRAEYGDISCKGKLGCDCSTEYQSFKTMNNSVRIVHPFLAGSNFKRCRGDKLRWLDPDVASFGDRRWAVAGRQHACVRDGQGGKQEGDSGSVFINGNDQQREHQQWPGGALEEGGNKHEFGGSGARFRRLRRRGGGAWRCLSPDYYKNWCL